MTENSLSGNSISLTYQSVMQLSLSTGNPIMDGYGTASQLYVNKYYGDGSNNSIKLNSVIYPTLNNDNLYNNNIFVTGDNYNTITGISAGILSTDDGNNILYKNINLNISNADNNTNFLVLQGTTFKDYKIDNPVLYAVSDYASSSQNNYWMKIGGDPTTINIAPAGRKIVRLWIEAVGDIYINEYGGKISEYGYNFSGVVPASVFNDNLTSTGQLHAVNNYNQRESAIRIYRYEYIEG